MKKTLLFTLIIIAAFWLNSTAQTRGSNSLTPITDATGKPVKVDEYAKIMGTPYLYDQWVPGQVTTANGEVYKDLLLKFDRQANLLTFAYDKKDEPQRFKDPIMVFSMYADKERVFANGFPKNDGLNTNTYYEVIAGGKTMLLEHHRQYIKNVRDEINRAAVVGEYTNYKHYYIFKDNKMYKAKLSADAVTKILADKASELNTYIASQKISFNNEDKVKELFNYYNSL